MIKLINRPWLHFLVLGTALFFLSRWAYPPPKPVIGPLGEARLDNLRQQWFATAGRVPTAEQLQRMAAAELDRDMLFQAALELEIHLFDTVVRQRLIKNMRFLRMDEDKTDEELYRNALRMELHLGDEVVKRRLVQAMEQLLLARARITEPDAIAVEQRFQEQKASLRRPPRYSIEHVFLTRDRQADIEQVAARIQAEQLTATQARQLSSPFLPGYQFKLQTPQQLARHFGSAFVLNLEQAGPRAGSWLAPIESTYGFHLVWIDAMEPERDARLEEVQKQISRDLLLERRNLALNAAVAKLRENYEVVL